MWAYKVEHPGTLRRISLDEPSADDLREGQIIARFLAGGICGSDVPKFRGFRRDTDPSDCFPLHEVCAEVVASRHSRLRPGMRVIGMVNNSAGFAEYFVNNGDLVWPVESSLTSAELTMVQPASTVMSALSHLPDVNDRHVAVIGQGPLGILFSHIMKLRGARRVVGVDRVARDDIAEVFGIDHAIRLSSELWSQDIRDDERPSICIEAVGHQQRTINDAITAVAPHGWIFAFGVPDDDYYSIAFERLFRKTITLSAGVTSDYQTFIPLAFDYVNNNPRARQAYLTNTLPVADAQRAFEIYSQPSRGRLKVVLTTEA